MMKKFFLFLYFVLFTCCFPSFTKAKEESEVKKSIRLLNQSVLTQREGDKDEELEMRDRNLKAEGDCCFPNRAQKSGEAYGRSPQEIVAWLNKPDGDSGKKETITPKTPQEGSSTGSN